MDDQPSCLLSTEMREQQRRDFWLPVRGHPVTIFQCGARGVHGARGVYYSAAGHVSTKMQPGSVAQDPTL